MKTAVLLAIAIIVASLAQGCTLSFRTRDSELKISIHPLTQTTEIADTDQRSAT